MFKTRISPLLIGALVIWICFGFQISDLLIVTRGLTPLGSPWRRGSPLRYPLLNLRFKAPVHRFVVMPLLGHVLLFDISAFIIVTVFVVFAVPQLLGALVMRITQVGRHRQRSSTLHVLARFADGHGGGVGFGRGRNVRNRLSQRQLAFRQANELDRLQCGRGDNQRLWISVADIL